ncbi:RNA-directed DNA polymerase, eukaryota [Tanacetum coccineum]
MGYQKVMRILNFSWRHLSITLKYDLQQPCHDRLKLNAPFIIPVIFGSVDEMELGSFEDEIRRGCLECGEEKKQSYVFKVDFAKAYDRFCGLSLEYFNAFGFGPNWCRWIRGTFTSSMASILVNGSPTSEFPLCCGLKQGDPLAPYLFILIMESLHISFSRVVDDGLFKGFQLHGSVNISHLFFCCDAMFIGEWSEQNLHNIVKVLNCFHLASGLKINIAKSQVLGVWFLRNVLLQAANRIGCAVLNTHFRYLGVTVGECMSRKSAWVGLVNKLQARLSNWKVQKGVLKTMESIRSKFFNGVDSSDRKMFRGPIIPSILDALFYVSINLWKDSGFDFLRIFPRLFALELDKEIVVANKMGASSVSASFRRDVRDGAERQQWDDLSSILNSVVPLDLHKDWWTCDLSGG